MRVSRVVAIPSHQQERVETRIDWIKETYPLPIIELFTMDRMLSYPILIGQSKELIMKPDEMMNAIVLGKDELGRSFIALRTLDENYRRCVNIVFQRYTDTNKIWRCKCHHDLDGFTSPDANILSDRGLQNNIKKLLDHDPQLEFPYYMREEQIYTKTYYLR
jgi:hypothetical protein